MLKLIDDLRTEIAQIDRQIPTKHPECFALRILRKRRRAAQAALDALLKLQATPRLT